MRKSFIVRLISVLLSFLFFSSMLYAGGVLSSPRRVYVLKTNHFDLIFPKESAETAQFVAKKADSLYEKAKADVGLKNDFSMPIVISPDSSVLDVKYTNRPYNRIVIFDAIPDTHQVESVYNDIEEEKDPDGRGNVLLALLYKEIFRAVSCSVRSPFNEFIHKVIGGDPYQPIGLVNLPFSFVEAYADISDGTENDRYFQKLLVQAKIENRFPSWFQATADRDIHPGNDLTYAAATGFASYLMQSRGLEKYSEFWEECGKLHFYFLNGIFYKIYKERLSAVWKEFEDIIPLPQELAQMEALESISSEVSENDRQGAFENILYTNYGVVWYDSIRHEVDIFDSNSTFKIRQLLFIADDIKKLALSPDGRYICASFTRETIRPEFKEDITRIFDLKEREFLRHKYALRDASFVEGKDGTVMIAGISSREKYPVLEVYPFNYRDNDTQMVYERKFSKSAAPFSVSGAGKGNLSYLLTDIDGTRLVIDNLTTAESRTWTLSDKKGEEIYPFYISYINSLSLFTFSYYPEEEGALSRSGYITVLHSDSEEGIQLNEIFIQNCDISGGVYYPVVAGERLYYCARKLSHNELRYISRQAIPFSKGQLDGQIEEILAPELHPELAQKVEIQRQLGDLDLSLYNPFKYMLKVSFTPLLAIRDITIEKGPVFWPSLGFYARTEADPMRNTVLILSGGLDFLLLSFEKEFNKVPKETKSVMYNTFGRVKKFNFGGYLENSSTPVDVAAGALFNFNIPGDYDFKAVAKTAWTIPIGNILRDIDFVISSIYLASTDYYDENRVESHPPKEGWINIQDSYQLMELSFGITYSNSHQYGISKYERRGITLGGRFYSLWDVYEINLLQKYRDEQKEKIKSGKSTELTEVQLDAAYQEDVINVSQVNLGAIGTVEIPRLNPLEIYKGWVLSLPSVVHAEFMNKTGTALEVNVESLLIGNEIQNGFPFLYLFFSRMGLKGGYAFRLDYDTTKVQLPDVRRDNYIAEVFTQTTFSDSLYMIFNTDFLVPTGKLSQIQFNMDLRGEYFLKTNGFKISFNII